ncbi:MAG: PRC-barrel domain-containing protein [Pontixanthobacter sp.]
MKNEDRFGDLDAMDDWQLQNSDQDIRGWPLMSQSDERYGVIADLLVDKEKAHVAAIRLDDGRMCGVNFLEILNDRVVYRDPEPDYVPIYHKVTSRRS